METNPEAVGAVFGGVVGWFLGAVGWYGYARLGGTFMGMGMGGLDECLRWIMVMMMGLDRAGLGRWL